MLPDIRNFTFGLTLLLAAGALSTFGLVRAGFVLSGRDVCESRIIAAVPSPDERLTAVVYRPRCAAGFGRPTVRVALASATGAARARQGEVFEADISRLEADPSTALELLWTEPNRLRIAYDPALRPRRRVAEVSGVQVWAVPR